MQIDTRKKNALAKKGIDNAFKLRRWYPLRYIDNTEVTGLSPELDGQHATLIGQLRVYEEKERRGGKPGDDKNKYISMRFRDKKTQAMIGVSIFGGFKWHSKILKNNEGKFFLIGGTLKYSESYGYQMANPDVLTTMIDDNMKMMPVYSKIKNVSNYTLMELFEDALQEQEEDTIPYALRNKYYDINHALKGVLFPENADEVIASQKRMVLDDMVYFQGQFELLSREAKPAGLKISSDTLSQKIISSLPYNLTDDQRKVFEEVRTNLYKGKRIRALVQGDVSCGKTIVAFLCMSLVAGEGHQAVLIAPTKILADQHFAELSSLLKDTGERAALIEAGKYTKKDLEDIKNGDIRFVIGTQALLSDKIEFKDLGLVVVDEEHKFGVEQRNTLRQKQEGTNSISMSATPIPRTLALSLFDENMSVYQIKQMPAGRKPVQTAVCGSGKILPFVRNILETGQQVYAVCPRIGEEEDDGIDMMSVDRAYEVYTKHFGDRYTVAKLTGETKKDESEQILNDFKDGKIDILVSTTVVEVGVNNPNATLMVIHNAERFGLSGLHQLRGRVGRGQLQSYCLLITDKNEDNERLSTLERTTDGFEIAEADMKYLRKTGNLFGEEQSGKNRYVEEMMANPTIFADAQAIVKKMTTKDLEKHIEKIEMAENTVKVKILYVE